MRRRKPELVVALLILSVLGWYVWYTRSIALDLQVSARRTSEMFARVYRAFSDTTPNSAESAVADLAISIRNQGVPLILADRNGVPQSAVNLPFAKDSVLSGDDARVRAYVPILERQHPPIVDSLFGNRVYYGDPPVVRGLRIIPVLQVLTSVILLLAGFYIIRTRHSAARERLWAGMARESAHQLGTPLSSLAGWIELMEERADAGTLAAVGHMRGDLDRLDRVAHRFERIGREPKFEPVNVVAIIESITKYFQARVPTLANTIAVDSIIAPDLPTVHGDPVLLEWAVEVLTKNAVDALAGRGGRIRLSAAHGPDDGVIIAVADDGPGIPRELRSRIFDPGFSTKKSGWGIGLSLAKRIVEENHGGRLVLANAERGATFEIILQ